MELRCDVLRLPLLCGAQRTGLDWRLGVGLATEAMGVAEMGSGE